MEGIEMASRLSYSLGLAALLGGAIAAQAQNSPVPLPSAPSTLPMLVQGSGTPASAAPGTPVVEQAPMAMSQDDAPKYGPTPLTDVNILNNFIYGDDSANAKIKFAGWMDFDYTFRSTGTGQNNIAPVMNRFGDEALVRQLGIYIYKPLDQKDWSWGFNAIFLGGADASFLGPTAGGWANPNPRFGSQFTDLNLTAHMPILTEGGVDVKVGRQSTVFGSQGAVAWARWFDSSDYAWYNLEEGRYTGVSTNWYITKQLSWYNGIEIGGWGVFYDNPSRNVNYIGQINYWLDEEAKQTQLTLTVLTGPTGFFNHSGNTTAGEVSIHENWTDRWYQIVSFQYAYSKAPLFFNPPPGYQERAYDVYSYLGYHLTTSTDVNTRIEWYKDVDGGGYPGGFGIPNTDYYAGTIGVDYHPRKCVQFRPEVRYDYATNNAFGSLHDKKNQVSIALETLFKF
jgi:hypothetical protein